MQASGKNRRSFGVYEKESEQTRKCYYEDRIISGSFPALPESVSTAAALDGKLILMRIPLPITEVSQAPLENG